MYDSRITLAEYEVPQKFLQVYVVWCIKERNCHIEVSDKYRESESKGIRGFALMKMATMTMMMMMMMMMMITPVRNVKVILLMFLS